MAVPIDCAVDLPALEHHAPELQVHVRLLVVVCTRLISVQVVLERLGILELGGAAARRVCVCDQLRAATSDLVARCDAHALRVVRVCIEDASGIR